MRFLHLTDVNGRHHIVNPLHIVSVQQTDSGCIVHLRGRGTPPIHLNETVELMGDALASCELDEIPAPRHER
jgi:hypothetical protein